MTFRPERGLSDDGSGPICLGILLGALSDQATLLITAALTLNFLIVCVHTHTMQNLAIMN